MVIGAISGTASVRIHPSIPNTIYNLSDPPSSRFSIYDADKPIIDPSTFRRHPDDGSNGDGTGGGDECVDGAMHLARRFPAEGGDSEIGGDGGGVGMARSISTSASGGRDMEA
ncbi:hypothetical protein Tco_0278634 [Tanacetum coccineum]